MDITMIEGLISNHGFPIVACLGLLWFLYQVFLKTTNENAKNMEKVQERCQQREERLYEEIAQNRAVNEKAIDTIAHYAEKLDVIQSDISDIKTDITKLTTKN
jgi:chromosome segregation ATPase